MLARNVTIPDLEHAARETGVVADIRAVTSNGRSTTGVAIRFGLTLTADRQWERRSYRGRRVHAVCWHGHREFFRALFRRVPDADVTTALARYTSPAHFEATFGATDKNIGSMVEPMQFSEACACPEGGF